MSETAHVQGNGPSHRGVEIGVAIAMIVFGAIVITGSLQSGIGWGQEGPKAGFFPFYLGIAIIAASVMNVIAALNQDKRQLFADWPQLFQVLSVVIPTAVYVVAVPYAGIYLASLILIAGFMLWFGRYGYGLTAAVSTGVVIVTFILFEKWFLVPLPKGPIEDWLGF